MKDIDLDLDREARIGLPEIIYGESKSVRQLQEIIAQLQVTQHNILISRLQAEKAEQLPGGEYNPVARTWVHRASTPPAQGKVSIVSAGSSDAPVVEECRITLEVLAVNVACFQDCGVAGIERLTRQLPEISSADVVICVAGFEGALASVIGGLVSQPVIAVPTSVGYGVAAGGQAALNAMLASCASGLLVMNIDNGCGAALAAKRILNRLYSHGHSQT